MDVAEHTLELLKRMHGEFAEFRRSLDSLTARASSLEQHVATMMGDIAQIRSELVDVRDDISQIKRRLNLVDA